MPDLISTPIDDLSILCHHDLARLSRDLLEQRDFTRAGVKAILHEIEHGATAVVVLHMLRSMVEEMETRE